jgi:cation diffusion facilitator family transporter
MSGEIQELMQNKPSTPKGDSNNPKNHQEKHWVAMTSVVAAVFLTTLKLVVGILTGSLGILSEAAHSALDLAAAVMTFFAVRLSGRPADERHTYGYGKIENLSALFETVLLLVTCVWIVYEAIQRLFFESVLVDVNVWSFLVMGTSIVIDIGRSRALDRAAKKYDSQALEADALHFSTDIWSSTVVIIGLILVLVAERANQPWLVHADAIAGIAVAGIVVLVSLQLGRRAVAGLLDTIPAGLRDEVVRAAKVPGVMDVRQARIRKSGPDTFADIVLVTSRDAPLEQAHHIADNAEVSIRKVLPGADVLVYVIPDRYDDAGLITTIRSLAGRLGVRVHGIRIYQDGNHGRSLEMHMEVSERLRLDEAHNKATSLENALKQSDLQVDNVVIHIEPAGDASATRQAALTDEVRILQLLDELQAETGIPCDPHDVVVYRLGGELSISFHCTLGGDVPIREAHNLTEEIERQLRSRLPELGRVVIHTEPQEQSNEPPPEKNQNEH